MSVYMYQASYSAAAMKSLIAKPEDRTGGARAAVEANGGTLIGAWMALGENDVVVIADMPDDESMVAMAMTIKATGAILSGKSTQLLTMEQAVTAMTKAQAASAAYSPPG